MVGRPIQGLALLDELTESGTLDSSHLYHSSRADHLRQGEWYEDAAGSYAKALELVQNNVEKIFLHNRLQEMKGKIKGSWPT